MHELFPLMKGQVQWDDITSQIIREICEQWNQVLGGSQYILIMEGIINLSLFTQFSKLLHLLIGKSDQQLDFWTLFYPLPQGRILTIVIPNKSTMVSHPSLTYNISKQNNQYAL